MRLGLIPSFDRHWAPTGLSVRRPAVLLFVAQFWMVGELAAQRIRVQLEGVGGQERRNALATMNIARATSERGVSEARVQRLHRRAPSEIALALQPFGYYRVQVESALRQDGQTWIARYQVDAGPRVVVNRLTVSLSGEGATEPRLRELVQRFPLDEGGPLSHVAYELGKMRMLNAATEIGYLDGAFETHEVRIDLASYTADIDLRFQTGPRYTFGPVAFDQSVVDPAILTSYIRFQRGQPFSIPTLLELQSALSDSPYFSRVEVVPRRDQARDLEVPIEVNTVARRPQRYELGVGFGTNTGPRGSFQVELRRLNQRGHRALGEASASTVDKRVSARYIAPLGSRGQRVLSLAAGFNRSTHSTSRSDAAVLSTALGRSRGRWQETLALTFQLEDFRVGPDSGTSNLLMPSGSWALTRANDRVFPTRGGRLRFELQGAVRGIASDASFGRVKLHAKAIRPITTHTRLLMRLDLGGTLTSNLRELPPSIRFFAGGDQSVRGYEYRSLGPTDALGNIVGGRVLATASVEVDQRIFHRVMLAAFIDAGDAMDSASWELEQGVGGGVRWLSPVGLVRVDLAFAVSRPGTPLRLHVTVGPDL